MKILNIVIPALMSVMAVHSANAAEYTEDTAGKQSMGVITANGAYSLDSLTRKLSEKADEQGASSFKIISASGNNKLHGTAEIYK